MEELFGLSYLPLNQLFADSVIDHTEETNIPACIVYMFYHLSALGAFKIVLKKHRDINSGDI